MAEEAAKAAGVGKTWDLKLGTGEACSVQLDVSRGLLIKVEGKESAKEYNWLSVDSLKVILSKVFVRIIPDHSHWWNFTDVVLECASEDEARALKIEMGAVRSNCKFVFDFKKESKSMFGGSQYFACEVAIKQSKGIRVTYPGHAKEVEFYPWKNVLELHHTRGISFTDKSMKENNTVRVTVLQYGEPREKIYKCKDDVQAQEFVTALSKMRTGFASLSAGDSETLEAEMATMLQKWWRAMRKDGYASAAEFNVALAFRTLDVDDSGELDYAELKHAMCEVGECPILPEEVDVMMEVCDTDGSGTIDPIEFATMLHNKYVCMEGETLGKVAKKIFGNKDAKKKWREFALHNGLVEKENLELRKGQVLSIPGIDDKLPDGVVIETEEEADARFLAAQAEEQQQEKAATKIQARTRGMQARRRVEALRAEAEAERAAGNAVSGELAEEIKAAEAEAAAEE